MARLAMAAILIFKATNKMNMSSATSDFNVTFRSLIFMLVMKNIKRWGLRGGVKWVPKNFEIQNLALIHLPIP